jgi:uracil-DNA glycosylase
MDKELKHPPIHDMLTSLESMIRYSGLEYFPVSPSQPEIVPADNTESVRVLPEDKRISVTDTYGVLRDTALSCTACRLHETRKNVVFGTGCTNNPPIAFVGEGPGADEDIQGEPFVGKAGQLLTAAITRGLKLKREDVYICNIVKCRPPENRTPLPDEISACSHFLDAQLDAVNPGVIVALGGPAAKYLLSTDAGITKLRGKWYEWRGKKVMPTFHPAYILRNPPAKKEFWEDLKLVMEETGLKI